MFLLAHSLIAGARKAVPPPIWFLVLASGFLDLPALRNEQVLQSHGTWRVAFPGSAAPLDCFNIIKTHEQERNGSIMVLRLVFCEV
jgi:hypothetical protein